MTIRKSKKVLDFNRTRARRNLGEAPALRANTASGTNGLALVIHFPDRRRVANLLQFPLPDRTGFAHILAIKSEEAGASLSGWPKITAIAREPNPKPVIQAPELRLAAADRQAIESGEDEGASADPE